MTVGCKDCESIPKVARAGHVVNYKDKLVQVMHDGTLVSANGYCGKWMTEIVQRLKGHHEPQEELIFILYFSIVGQIISLLNLEVGGLTTRIGILIGCRIPMQSVLSQTRSTARLRSQSRTQWE